MSHYQRIVSLLVQIRIYTQPQLVISLGNPELQVRHDFPLKAVSHVRFYIAPIFRINHGKKSSIARVGVPQTEKVLKRRIKVNELLGSYIIRKEKQIGLRC
jgi:hypothetical protein